MSRQVKQFAEAELQYWRKEFATTPPSLPLLTLAKVDECPVLKA